MNGDWDCVVVGGGAAGLSAALVLGRARRRTLVLDNGGQSNQAAEKIGGLLGQDGAAPAEFYARAREQLGRYDAVTVAEAEVTDAAVAGEGLSVALGDGGELRAPALILATGMDYEFPDLPGFREHWGRSVFHCPFCHGWEVRDLPLVVCGEGPMAERQTALLRAWSDDVRTVAPGDVAGLRVEDGTVRAVALRDGSEIPCAAVLVHAPLYMRGQLPERLGLAFNDAGLLETDAHGRTSLPGVYAAGDVAVGPQQVAIAMGSGHKAGIAATADLLLGRP